MFIVAGHGDNPISDGLWRTVDILIGIALALAFSFALPLYAVYSWRYNLASALRDCAQIYSRIINGQSVTDDEHLKLLNRLQQQLGVAYLFITHDVATVRAIADEVLKNPSRFVDVLRQHHDFIAANYQSCDQLVENEGHRFGEDLSEADKKAVTAFLATL